MNRSLAAVAVVLWAGAARAADPVLGDDPSNGRGPRVLVMGVVGNAPAEARAAATGATADALGRVVADQGWVRGCQGVAAQLMGTGVEPDACRQGKLRDDERWSLGANHVVAGELMKVDTTLYVTLRVYSNGSSAARLTGTGSGGSPEAAVREAVAQMTADLQKEWRLAVPPPPAAATQAGGKAGRRAPLQWLVAARAPGATEFDCKQGELRAAVAGWTRTQRGTWGESPLAELPPADVQGLAEDGVLRSATVKTLLGPRARGEPRDETARLLGVRVILSRNNDGPAGETPMLSVHGVLQASVMDANAAVLATRELEVDLLCPIPNGGVLPCAQSLAKEHLTNLVDDVWEEAGSSAEPPPPAPKPAPAPR